MEVGAIRSGIAVAPPSSPSSSALFLWHKPLFLFDAGIFRLAQGCAERFHQNTGWSSAYHTHPLGA